MIPHWVMTIFEVLLLASMALCLARVALGPSAADRMVAIDLLGLLIALMMIGHAIRSGDGSMLDVVLIFSVVAFFGTVALARYLQRESDESTDRHD